MSEIRIADLFAGIGGIRMGMVQALGDAAHVVYSSEWNKYSVQTYEANWHDERPVAGDITKVDEHDVPDIDLLLAGFPCQPFSIAGVSKKQSMGRPTGFEDKTQGTLFFDVARIIKAKQPKAFLLENVKNLLSHDRGRTFKTIYSVLTEDLGYHTTSARSRPRNCRPSISTPTAATSTSSAATTRSEDCSAPARTAEPHKGTAYPPRSCT